jgi:[1-hydroxy-2-(trimethylamino)ethyl]phosphonate dioxygenase
MIVDEIVEVFERHGSEAYFGEPISQLEHALQTAYQAERVGAPESLIIAALLHDIGHLLHCRPENIAESGHDARHEVVGAQWLTRSFEAPVTEPVRLHVTAKRYLCTIDAEYRRRLSPASMDSLTLQGGLMESAEARAFEVTPYSNEAVLLRQWDENAKVVGMKTPPLRDYRGSIESLAALKAL